MTIGFSMTNDTPTANAVSLTDRERAVIKRAASYASNAILGYPVELDGVKVDDLPDDKLAIAEFPREVDFHMRRLICLSFCAKHGVSEEKILAHGSELMRAAGMDDDENPAGF